MKMKRNKFHLGVVGLIAGIAIMGEPVAHQSSWSSALDDMIVKMATVFSYGGKGIVTNRLKGSGTEPVNGGWGINPGSLTAATSDTSLFDPGTETRVAGTSTQQTTSANNPNDTYQVVVTITCSGAGKVIREFGLFDASAAAPQTTLAATLTTATTNVGVGTTAGLAAGNFIQIDGEVCSLTTVSAGSITFSRAARGSTSATHASGANVVGGEGTASGNMFMKGDFGDITLNIGDSIQFTAKVQFT